MSKAPTAKEKIQEYVDSRGEPLQVERGAGVLRGVKLLGVASRNGRRYPDAVLRRAMPLYEGAKVNVNHPKGDPLSPREYQDRIGVIRNVEFRPGAGLFGVLHFNPHHTLAEQLAWDAEHAPENVGLSHNVLARTSLENDGVVVDEITSVRSVALVADPATTRGLFEQRDRPTASASPEEQALAGLTLEVLTSQRPDLIELITAPIHTELAACREAISRHELREAADQRRRLVERLLVEHGLPAPAGSDASAERLISPGFLQMLLEAPTESEVDRLVRDRAEALDEARRWRPPRSPASSREQTRSDGAAAPADTADAFVAAITAP